MIIIWVWDIDNNLLIFYQEQVTLLLTKRPPQPTHYQTEAQLLIVLALRTSNIPHWWETHTGWVHDASQLNYKETEIKCKKAFKIIPSIFHHTKANWKIESIEQHFFGWNFSISNLFSFLLDYALIMSFLFLFLRLLNV